MPAGRPTVYDKDTITKTKEYLANFADYGDAIPSIVGLARALDVARDTVYEWAKHEDKAEFSDILEKILTDQERTLLNGGLTKKFDSSITKLALGKHGYKELKDMTSDNKAINKELADAIDKALDDI